MRFTSRLAACAAIASLALAACGDDEDDDTAGGTGPAVATETTPAQTQAASTPTEPDPSSAPPESDAGDIERVVRALFLSEDPARTCGAMSRRLLARIYDTRARCLRLEREDEEDDEAEDVTVSSTQVDGATGTTQVRVSGGDVTGAGRVDVRRESGGWRVDGLGGDFVSSALTSALRNSDEAVKDAPYLRLASVTDCVEGRLEGLPEADLQKYLYDSIGEREGSEEPLGRILLGCAASDEQGRAAIRKQFEGQISSDDDLPPALRRCMVRELRRTASDEVIARAIQDSAGEDRAKAAAAQRKLRGLGQQAARSCSAGQNETS